MKILKEWVIVLNSYERHSFFRFFFIYILALVFLFSALASLYFYKEHYRYFQEQKVRNKIKFSECRHLKKLLPSAPECRMQAVILDDKVTIILKDIAFAFVGALFLILPFGYFLARLSLRPMRDAVSAMDGFINGIVHDINTPLSVIRMNAQSLNKVLESEKLQKKSLRVLQGVAQIESLEEQLLFSLKVGQYILHKQVFDLAVVLNEREGYWNALRPSISVNVEAESLMIDADMTAMIRMIDNIVGNAIKYSLAKGDVIVKLGDQGLEIIDYGVGIKHPKEVFKKYYREGRDSKGVGIGLYIVAEIARLHHLEIQIYSKLGKGSRFKIDMKSLTT